MAQAASPHATSSSLPALAEGWDTLVIPLLGPLLCFRKTEHRYRGGEKNPMPPRSLSVVHALTTDLESPLDGCHAGTGYPTGSRTVHDRCRALLPWPWLSRDLVAPLSPALLTKEREIGFANAPAAASRPRSPSLDTIIALRAPIGHPQPLAPCLAELQL